MFPLVLDLADRRVVVVGAGRVGALKAHQLTEGGAHVTVIATEVTAAVPPDAEVLRRPYRDGDLEGALLVVAATGRREVDDAIVREARSRNVLVNVVDVPERCTFYFTANHRDGDVVVAVSTQGASPSLATWIRDEIARVLPRGLGDVARRLRRERDRTHRSGASTEGLDWGSRISEFLAAPDRRRR